MFCRQHVIYTPYRGVVRCAFHDVGILLCLLCYLTHHADESVECLLALVLWWFNHQALVEEQREIDGRRMIAVVEQSLRNIHRGDAC